MPDITMCNNEECGLSYNCWRFNAPPNIPQQSYAKFEPVIDEETQEEYCSYFMKHPNKPTI